MAVEAGGTHHHTLFHPQMLISNNAINNNNNQSNGLLPYGIPPLSATYCSGFTDSINHFPTNNAAPIKAESGLTCSLPVSRKRARDSSEINTLLSFVNSHHNIMNNNNNQNQMERSGGGYTFLGEDISLEIQQQQLEIDQFIAHHTEKVRLDVEERRKRNSRRIIMAVEEGISKRLRAKEEEIVKIAKLNWALEEKVKSLCVENQIWRELAQTNEATANALRNNLKQLLQQDFHRTTAAIATADDIAAAATAAAMAEDAQSCCESNNNEENHNNSNNDEISSNYDNDNNNKKVNGKVVVNENICNRICRNCGKYESCVLLLPCRHLCLCTGCGSSVNICPICKSTKNISVHVNMS